MVNDNELKALKAQMKSGYNVYLKYIHMWKNNL